MIKMVVLDNKVKEIKDFIKNDCTQTCIHTCEKIPHTPSTYIIIEWCESPIYNKKEEIVSGLEKILKDTNRLTNF